MANKEDWAAAMSSEVFRNYARNELLKSASEVPLEISKEDALDNFEGLEKRINASPDLRNQFKKLQRLFTSDPDYTAKVDPKFVEGILLLDLKDE